MTIDYGSLLTVALVLERNAALDVALINVARRVTPDMLHASQGPGRWTLAEQLAHLGEFPRFFARDLSAWIVSRQPVGRTHEHPQRLAAVDAARTQSLDALLGELASALQALADTLSTLTPDDLVAQMENRKYGLEPFSAYLNRYILDHKAKHIGQVERSLAYLATGPQPE